MKKADSLLDPYQGELRVIVEDLGEFTFNFRPEVVGRQITLFDYVGQACAVLATNLTTQLQVETRPQDWEIVRFSPEEKLLIVKQVVGKIIEEKPDDPEKLNLFLGVINTPGF